MAASAPLYVRAPPPLGAAPEIPHTASVPIPSRRRAAAAPLYEVRRSRIQGRGAFALRRIRTGQRVDEYLGEHITHDEADRRYDDSNGRHHTFLFVLDDTTVIDARYGGNDARFLNHSCDPNCESEIDGKHVYIKAIKPIAPETELVYDYRFEWQDDYEPDDVRYYACRCGAAKCRGTILLVPRYLRATVARWLAGDDVRKPRKPRRPSATTRANKRSREKAVKNAAKKATKNAGKNAVKNATKNAVKNARKKSGKQSVKNASRRETSHIRRARP